MLRLFGISKQSKNLNPGLPVLSTSLLDQNAYTSSHSHIHIGSPHYSQMYRTIKVIIKADTVQNDLDNL